MRLSNKYPLFPMKECLKGEANIVFLTVNAHKKAHALLYFLYKKPQDALAANIKWYGSEADILNGMEKKPEVDAEALQQLGSNSVAKLRAQKKKFL
jgi:hypothetical protein